MPASLLGAALPASAMPQDPPAIPRAGGDGSLGQGQVPMHLARTRLVTGVSLPPWCRLPRTRPCPPASHPDGFLAPLAPPALLEALRLGNWTWAEPSPPCQCSGPGAHRMLPDCPEGAGGLPPPQVTPSLQRGQPGPGAPVLLGAGACDALGRPAGPCVHPAHLSVPPGAKGHRRCPAEPDRQEHLRLPGEDLPPDHPLGVSAGAGDTTGTPRGHRGEDEAGLWHKLLPCWKQGGMLGTKPSQGWRR